MLTSRTISKFEKVQLVRCVSSLSSSADNNNIKPVVYNRNPHNLERMRIGYKPSGYHLDAADNTFWHKLEITRNNRYVTASIIHFSGKKVVEASTNEWCIKKFLYRDTDTAAYMNLAKIFVNRCLESGIYNVYYNNTEPQGKLSVLLAELEKSGLCLSEPSRFYNWRPWDRDRPEKPWEVVD